MKITSSTGIFKTINGNNGSYLNCYLERKL